MLSMTMSAPNPEPKPQVTPTGCDNTNYCTWNGRGWECVGRKNKSLNILGVLSNVIAEDVSKLEPVLAGRRGKLNLRNPQSLNFQTLDVLSNVIAEDVKKLVDYY